MRRIITFLLLLNIFVFFLLPPTDPDLGWELRCGELIIKQHNLCTPDQFSTLLPGYNWVNSRWLYQLILYKTYTSFGLWGISILGSTIITSSFFLLSKIWRASIIESLLAISLITLGSWQSLDLGLRAQILSIFFFAFVLYCLFKTKKRNYPFILLPLVFLLWANSHGGVLIGLAIFAFYFLLYSKKIYALLSFTASILATLINPFGLRIYTDALFHETGAHLEHLIAEWVRPNPLQMITIISLTLFLLVLLWLNRKNTSLLASLPIFTFCILALTAVRHLPFFYILFFASLFAIGGIKKFSIYLKDKENIKVVRQILTSILAGLFIIIFLYHLPYTSDLNSNWQSFCSKGHIPYPCQAVEFIKKNKKSGNIFNRYEWGGFLIWQLPDSKIFVDGRMPAWRHPSGKSPYTIFLETVRTESGWEETLVRYNTDILLIERGSFLDLRLQNNDTKWHEVYRDAISVIYTKTLLSDYLPAGEAGSINR